MSAVSPTPEELAVLRRKLLATNHDGCEGGMCVQSTKLLLDNTEEKMR